MRVPSYVKSMYCTVLYINQVCLEFAFVAPLSLPVQAIGYSGPAGGLHICMKSKRAGFVAFITPLLLGHRGAIFVPERGTTPTD